MLNYTYVLLSGFLYQMLLCKYSDSLEYGFKKQYQIFSAISTGLISMCLFYIYSFSLEFFIYTFSSTILINLSFIDSQYLEIPDEYSLILLFLAITNLVLSNSVVPTDMIFGGLAGGGIYLLMAIVSNGGIGGGDIKIAASIGLILGTINSLLSIYYAFLLAIVGLVFNIIKAIKRKKETDVFEIDKEMAFGPYIAISAIMIFLQLA